jgi:alpha-2-macroglobulin
MYRIKGWHSMRRSLLIIVAVVALVFVGFASVPRVSGVGEIAPRVIDTDPVRGEELRVDSSITFYFDQPMNRESVEAAFRVEPAVEGAFNWSQNDTVLTFDPTEPLERATEYRFEIGESAQNAEGTAIRDRFAMRLRTVGYLEVAQVIPADATQDVEDNPTITVVFNRPVVPLLPVDEMATLPSPITITPDVEGEGTWLNTSIYTFTPAEPLRGATTYTVTVNAGLEDITGSVLREDYVFRFSTVQPRAIEVRPDPEYSNTNRLRDQEFTVIFSQEMDRAAVEAAFFLGGEGGERVSGTFEWNENSNRVTFTPSELLNYDSLYILQLDRTQTLSATGAPLSEDVYVTYETIPQPQISGTYPEHQTEERTSGFAINFTAPMEFDEDFASRFTIDPVPAVDYEDYAESRGFYYRLGFGHEPSTEYTLTFDTNGLTDIYGTPLVLNREDNGVLYEVVAPGVLEFRWSTPAYPAEATLRTGGFFGLYSAYNPTTRVYSTHRNINRIDLSLYRVELQDFLRMLEPSNWEFRSDYTPTNLLRSWSVPVENPPNVLRYDLLQITDEGFNAPVSPAAITCEGALSTRFNVGMRGLVSPSDPTPLNVRATPERRGSLIAQIPPPTTFDVIGGPTCADSIIWWQIRTQDGVTGWVAEGTNGSYFIDPITSSEMPANLADANAADKPLAPGLYFLAFGSPDLYEVYYDLEHAMMVATANVTLKFADNEVMAWVTDLQSGLPVPNANVDFYMGDEVTLVGSATTDENGLARLDLRTEADLPPSIAAADSLYQSVFAVVQDQSNFSIGFIDWDSGINPWDFNQSAEYYVQNITAYLYTDRSLYRPGQPVYYRGVLRDRDDMTYTPSERFNEVRVQVYDAESQIVHESVVSLTEFGTFSGSFDIDAGAPLGYYTLNVLPAEIDETTNWQFTRGFTVAQYRVPEFQVQLEAQAPEVVQGDTINVEVESSFFFGGAVSNAQVNWTVFSNSYFFNYRGQGRYDFLDQNEDEGYFIDDGSYNDLIAEGSGVTDAQGRFTITLPADLGEVNQSQTFTIEAVVTDESDQAIAGRAEVTVHQGQFYIGASPEEYIGIAGEVQQINLTSVNWDSSARPNTDLSVRVVERRWSSTQTVEPDTGRTVWEYEVEELPVTEGVVRTDADGRAIFEFTPEVGGVYKIYATSRDERGNQITTSTFLWVAGTDYVPWRQQNSNRIDLKIDRDSYQVGDTAEILIASPFQGETTALITVERGHILQTEVLRLNTNSAVYRLPITPDMAPNAYVTVTLVKGVDETNPVAAFRMGMIQFGVNAERLQLNIDVQSDKPQAGPGEEVTYTVRVTDYQGEPVRAEVGLGLTDLAVLSLLPDTSTPIMQHFYSQVGISVRTSSSLVISVDQQTQEILNTIKGGGGGGPEGGIFEVRQRFIDTPLWSPNVVTDENGEAQVTVTLPDNLTTWRLDARAVTNAAGELGTTLVGQTTSDLISTKPLLIRPVTPRFFVVGDKSTLVAIVNNNTDAPQTVTTRIEVAGMTLLNDAAQTAEIPALGRSRFEWQVEVGDVENVDVTFFASTPNNEFTDAAKSAVGQGDERLLPVNKYEVPETVATAGVIGSEGGSRTEGIILPRRYNVTQGDVQIRLDRSLASATVDALEAWEEADYEFIEYSISRTLPNLAAYSAFTELGVENDALEANLRSLIDGTIQRLYAEQKPDGGWGWIYTVPSNPTVTAYAVILLSEARRQGFAVDEQVLSNAIRYLNEQVVAMAPHSQAPTWRLNRWVFILYALSYADAGNFAQQVRAFELRENLSVYARAMLAMAFHNVDPQNTRYTDALLSDLQNRAILSATGAHWEEDYDDYWNWNTDTRTTALALRALVQIDPDNQLIPNAVRWLMVVRNGDTWETWQETAWVVMGLVDYMRVTGELRPDYSFGAILNGETLVESLPATVDNVDDDERLVIEIAQLLTSGELNTVTINRSAGDGVLYYTTYLNAYLPVDQVEPLSRGITITRQYNLTTDEVGANSITEARVGDNIRVTLTIVAPNDLHYVVINDPIPAGTDPVNPELATSALGQEIDLSRYDPRRDGYGWWYFNRTELRDDRVVLYADYLPEGTYQFTYTLRAGLAGEYNVIPATGQEVYFPEVYGRTEGLIFRLLPALPGNDPTNPVEETDPADGSVAADRF